MLAGCSSTTLHNQSAHETQSAAPQPAAVKPSDPAPAPTPAPEVKPESVQAPPAQEQAQLQPNPQSQPAAQPQTQPAKPAPAPQPAPKPAPQPAQSATPAPAPQPTSTESQENWPLEQIDFSKVTLDCDLSDQRVYAKMDGQVVRTMITSSGLDTIPDNSTPRGEFQVEPERGTWFYTNNYSEGAKYWVSFKGHGVFLFHSVVMDKNQQVIEAEAQKLGTKASHGCFRLPLQDAKWIYDHVKTGTKVSIHD
ncbi:L,D-transpeptidase family protein [Tumebacillus sp. ITR2]|uniref:L,D-transpeptidase family protein n=2 Tax=Tumebacillus amylolyticus TaxID=2801339 RepID=A0ABS1JD21_9BACL|nr:L,D-transpeptidase family protein [Tumebacillus amylolyticus]